MLEQYNQALRIHDNDKLNAIRHCVKRSDDWHNLVFHFLSPCNPPAVHVGFPKLARGVDPILYELPPRLIRLAHDSNQLERDKRVKEKSEELSQARGYQEDVRNVQQLLRDVEQLKTSLQLLSEQTESDSNDNAHTLASEMAQLKARSHQALQDTLRIRDEQRTTVQRNLDETLTSIQKYWQVHPESTARTPTPEDVAMAASQISEPRRIPLLATVQVKPQSRPVTLAESRAASQTENIRVLMSNLSGDAAFNNVFA